MSDLPLDEARSWIFSIYRDSFRSGSAPAGAFVPEGGPAARQPWRARSARPLPPALCPSGPRAFEQERNRNRKETTAMSSPSPARAQAATLWGIEAQVVDIEVQVKPGTPRFEILGLGQPAARESRERVRAALRNCGFDLNSSSFLVNLTS